MPNQSQSDAPSEALLPCPFCGSEAKRKRILKIDHVMCTRCGVTTGIGLWNKRAVAVSTREPSDADPQGTKRLFLGPTPEMIEAGAQRLVRWETGKEKWPDAWSKMDVRAARNDAERCWLSMWLAAPSFVSERAAKAYADKNPLGGPAVMFEAMAERIRAGEDYYAVLADYSLAHVPNGGSRKLLERIRQDLLDRAEDGVVAVGNSIWSDLCDYLDGRTSQEGAEGPGPGECNDFLGKPGHYRGDRK